MSYVPNSAERIDAVRQLKNLVESLTLLNESPQVVRDTLYRIANTALTELGADTIDLYQYEPETRKFVLPPIVLGERRYPNVTKDTIRDDDVVAIIARTNEKLYASNALSDPTLVAGWKEPRGENLPLDRFVVREGIVSSAAIPLAVGDKVLGVMFAGYRQARDFDAEPMLRDDIETFAHFAGIAIKNARTLYKENVLRQQADLFLKVSSAIRDSRDLREIAETILDGLQNLIGYDKASMQMIEGDNRWLVACRGFDPAETDRWLMRPVSEDRLVSRILKDGQPCVLSYPQFGEDPDWDVHPGTSDVRSWVGIPLQFGDQPLGFLTLDHSVDGHYSPAHLDVLVPFANQATIALHHVRMEDLKRTQLQALHCLEDLHQLPHRQSRDELFKQILNGLNDILGPGTTSSINTYDATTDTFGSLEVVGPLAEDLRVPPRPNGTARYVLTTKESLFLDDIRHPGNQPTIRNADDPNSPIRSFAAMPLWAAGSIIGILFVHIQRPEGAARPVYFSSELRGVLELFAGQAATALENVRLYRELGERTADLVNEVVDVINTKLEPQALFDTIVHQIAEKLNCTYCTLFLAQKENGEEILVRQATNRPGTAARRFKKGEGIAGRVYATGRSEIIPDVAIDSGFVVPVQGQGTPRSMLVAPIKIGDQTIGVISADQDFIGHFTENDQRLVDALAKQVGIAVQRSVALQLLQRVGQGILAADKQEEILKLIVSGAIDLTNTTSGVIYLLTPDGLSVTATYQYPPTFKHPKPRMNREDSITRQVFRSGEMMVFPRIQADRQVNRKLVDRVQSMISVPLQLDQQVIGVLYLNDANPHDFTDTECSLLRTLAAQAALAIQKVSFIDRIQKERADRIAAIRDIGFGILATKDLDTVLHGLLLRTIGLMKPGCVGQVCLWEESEQALRVVASEGVMLEQVTKVKLGEGVIGRVAKTKKPYLVRDAATDRYFVRHLAGTRAEVAVPLLRNNQLVGVLNLEHPIAAAFGEEEVLLLQAIASQVVIAFENAKLYRYISDDLEKRIKQMTVVQGIYDRILKQGIESVDRILDLIYEETCEVVDLNDELFYVAFCDGDRTKVSFGLAIEKEAGTQIDEIRWGRRQGTDVPRWAERPFQNSPRLTEYVILQEQPVLIERDFSRRARAMGISFSEQFGLHDRPTMCWLGVPLIAGGQVIGVVSIQSLQEELAVTQDELALMETVANLAAVAIQNANLYQSARGEAVATKQIATLGIATAALQHRINNTFNIIVPNVQRLRLRVDLDDPAIAEILDIIERNARYTSKIIERIQEPLRELAIQEVDINGVLTEVVNRTKEMWGADSSKPLINFVLHLGDDLPHVMAPIGQMTEVFNNLVDNACRAMKDGGTLTVTSQYLLPNETCVLVQDSGPGIPPHIQDRLFHKPVPSKEPGGGAGLGLWLSRLILQSVGGDVKIDHTGSVGTAMLVSIPSR